MKKIIYFLIISATCITCAAQTRLTPGEIKGKHETFTIHLFKSMTTDTQKLLVVYSKSNKYNKGIPRAKNPNAIPYNPKTDVHVNNDSIRSIIYRVLNNIDELKKNKEEMGLIFAFELNGDLTQITFSLHGNTLITLQQIEEIDKQLRANVKASFTGKWYSQFPVIDYHPPKIIF